MFVTEVHPRGYGYRAPTRSRLTAACSPDGERARRQEGPRWRRLRFLLRRGSLSLVCGALLRERDARERRGERNEARVQREAGRGGVLIRRNGWTVVEFDSTAWNHRATQWPRRASAPRFAGPGPRCGLGGCVRARAELGRAVLPVGPQRSKELSHFFSNFQ